MAVGVGRTELHVPLAGDPGGAAVPVVMLTGTHAQVDSVSMRERSMAGWTATTASRIWRLPLSPLASVLLLAPQRRAPDRDAHRPL